MTSILYLKFWNLGFELWILGFDVWLISGNGVVNG